MSILVFRYSSNITCSVFWCSVWSSTSVQAAINCEIGIAAPFCVVCAILPTKQMLWVHLWKFPWGVRVKGGNLTLTLESLDLYTFHFQVDLTFLLVYSFQFRSKLLYSYYSFKWIKKVQKSPLSTRSFCSVVYIIFRAWKIFLFFVCLL